MIIYDRLAEEVANKSASDYVIGTSIYEALRRLARREFDVHRGSACRREGRSATDRGWICVRTKGHIGPHVSAGSSSVHLVWTDD